MALVEFLSQGDQISGLYQGEDPALFPLFLDKIVKIIRNADSPRNRIMAMIEEDQELASIIRVYYPDWQWNNNIVQLTNLLEQISQTHFRDYRGILSRINCVSNAVNDLINDTPVRARVIENLKKATYPGRPIDELINRKKETLHHVTRIRLQMEDTPEVQHFMALQDKITRYRDLWHDCNMEIGTINRLKGDRLEACHPFVIEELAKRGHQTIASWNNVHWAPKGLGEIDLLLQTTSGWVIVEFKARAHDIMSAYYQNGPGRDSRKQVAILSDTTEIILPLDTPMYVVTVVPNCFVLPIDSELKRVLSYSTKHPHLGVDQIYAYARTVIPADRPSPYRWYLEGGANHVIVMPEGGHGPP